MSHRQPEPIAESEDVALRWRAMRGGLPMPGESEIHVWSVDVDAPFASTSAHAAILSPDERLKAARFRFEIDRHRFLQRRTALRSILARYLDVAPRDIAYALNAFGKPEIAQPAGARLAFNVSHSEGIALIAVAKATLLGVDIERLKPVAEAESIAARFFAASEAAVLASLDVRDRAEGFLNAWTRKEAVVKALGGGLSIPLDGFEVSLAPADPPALLRCAFDPQLERTLRLARFDCCSGYVGAIAAGPNAFTIRHGMYAQ